MTDDEALAFEAEWQQKQQDKQQAGMARLVAAGVPVMQQGDDPRGVIGLASFHAVPDLTPGLLNLRVGLQLDTGTCVVRLVLDVPWEDVREIRGGPRE
jgi:hypothetical protein